MDFYQLQDNARRNTGWMVFIFILGVLCVVLAIDAIAYIMVYEDLYSPKTPADYRDAVNVLIYVSVGTLAVILLGSLYRSWELRSAGGRGVAEALGGRLVSRRTSNRKEQQLLNVVEEMALASGMPVPPVYIMDAEDSINAFAAGISPEDAVVAVTRGTLETLTRDELQGVIGHEFSHILNGDMRMNIRLMGILYGILLIYTIGYYVLIYGGNSKSSDSKESGGGKLAVALIALWTMLVGSVGVLFGTIIKAAVSRQREFLADASSAQFTRNPLGLANALKKIAGMPPENQSMHSAAASEASHLFFSDYSTSFFSRILATHPPLEERIARLDASFTPRDGHEMKQQPYVNREKQSPVEGLCSRMTSDYSAASAVSAASEKDVYPGNSAAASVSPAVSASTAPSSASASVSEAESAAASVSASGSEASRAKKQRQKKEKDFVPEWDSDLRLMLSSASSACAYVFAILTDEKNPAVAETQKRTVSEVFGGAVVSDYRKLLVRISKMKQPERLMFLQLGIPALKQLSPPQYASFRNAVRTLIFADSVVDLNEYVIFSVVCRQLDIAFGLRRAPTGTGAMTYDTFRAAVVVLSRLAFAGSSDPAAQQAAFRLGVEKLAVSDAVLLSEEECSNSTLESALKQLDAMQLTWKREFLEACSCVIYADGIQTEDEAVLQYGIAASLGVYGS